MPPCAQTECDRFTGTMEKSSTGTPDSATRIVAISPARPPPTTMILAVSFSYVKSKGMPVQPEAENNQNSDNAKCNSDHRAEPPGRLLRPGGRGQAPLAKKIPDAHA